MAYRLSYAESGCYAALDQRWRYSTRDRNDLYVGDSGCNRVGVGKETWRDRALMPNGTSHYHWVWPLCLYKKILALIHGLKPLGTAQS